MKCSVCKDNFMDAYELPGQPKAYLCSSCHGIWIRFDDYDEWNKRTGINNPPPEKCKDNLLVKDCKQAKFCPDCSTILTKYRVDNTFDFLIDHCGNCGGIWLDENKWEILEINNLHTQIYHIVTDPWQRKIREKATKEQFVRLYSEKFSSEDYETLRYIRKWLYASKNKSEMLAYLLNSDPYKM